MVNKAMHIDWTDTQDLSQQRVALQQSREYATALRMLGCDVQVATICDGGTPIARAQFIMANRPVLRRIPLMSRGPVWLAENLSPVVKYAAIAALNGAMKSTAHLVNAATPIDDQVLQSNGYARLMPPQTVALLDLASSADKRSAAQNGKWRNRLRSALKADLDITQNAFSPARDQWLLSAETAQRRARRYQALPQAFTLAFARSNPKKARLFLALHRGAPIAAMLFLLHGATASYHIGWTGPDGRRKNAHTLLLWTASNWLADQGFLSLDLGTIHPQTPRLNRFKLGSGATLHPLGATWIYSRPSAFVMRHLPLRRQNAA